MADAPDQFIIVQDRNFVQATKESLTTKESGSGGGIASASSSNMGTLKCTTVGTFKSTAVDLDFRVQDSGSLSSTTWAWKLSSDNSTATSDVYYGQPDGRFSWNEQGAFGPDSSGRGQGLSATGVYNEKIARVICYRIIDSTTIQYSYKDLDDADYNGNQTNWNKGNITVEGIDDADVFDLSVGQGAQIDACSLSNGTYRMAVKFNDDIDIYYSDDGLNWTLFAEKILSRFANARINFNGLKIAASGDFVKVTFVSQEDINIQLNINAIPDESVAETLRELDEMRRSAQDVGVNVFGTYVGGPSQRIGSDSVGFLDAEYNYNLQVNLINSLISSDLGATWTKKQVGTTRRESDINYQLSKMQSEELVSQFFGPNLFDAAAILLEPTYELLDVILADGNYADKLVSTKPLSDAINEILSSIPYSGMIDPVGRDVYNYDCIGLDDTSGTFLISTYRHKSDISFSENSSLFSQNIFGVTAQTAFYEFVTYFSVGLSAYSEIKTLRKDLENSGDARLFLCNGQNYIWAYFDNITKEHVNVNRPSTNKTIFEMSSADRFMYNFEEAFYYFDKSSVITSATWTEIGVFSTFEGSKRYRATRGKLFAIGDGINLVAGLADTELTMNAAYVPYNMYKRWGGWQTRPVSVNQLSNYREGVVIPYQPEGRLYDIAWVSLYGAPKGLHDSLFTQWEMQRSFPVSSLSVSVAWFPQYTRLTSPSGLIDRKLFFRWNDYRSENGGTTSFAGKLYSNSLDTGWVFSPNENPTKGGSCVMWACKVAVAESISKTAAIRVFSYVPEIAPNTRTGVPNGVGSQIFKVEIRMTNDKVIIYDLVSGTTAETLAASDLGTDFYEFRLGIQPIIATTTSQTRSAKFVLCFRKFGTETWQNSSVHFVRTQDNEFGQFSTSNLRQGIDFGHITASKTTDSFWKYVKVHQGSDLSTFDLIDKKPDSIRGKLISSNKAYIKYGIYNFWGGVGGAEGDTFDADVRYANAVTNALSQASPRVQFRSNAAPTGSTEDIVLKAPEGKEFEMHTAFSVFKCNAQTVTLAYSDDNVSYTTAGTINLEANSFTVSSVSGKKMTGTFANTTTRFQYNSDDNVVYYASVQTAYGSITQFETFEIVKHDGNTLLLDLDNSSATDLSSITSSAVFKIYADRGYIRYSSAISGTYIKVSLGETRYSYEGVSILGSAVAGTYLDFTVPLDWAYTDKQDANVTTYKTKGGVSWGYKEGPPIRTIEAKMIGDVSTQQRQQIRDLLNMENAFIVAPIVLILNHEARDYANFYDSRNIVLCRWVSGTDLKNDGWFYDNTNSMWRPVGDMTVTVEEIV